MPDIFLDNAATTKVAKEVVDEMLPYFEDFYQNPSSLHDSGSKVRDDIEQARENIAEKLGASSHEIIFTSGGTEANNLAIKGIALQNKKGTIITQKTEHLSVLNTCKALEEQGFEVKYLDVDKSGFVNTQDLRDAIDESTILVTIMHANNEIGTIQDIKALYQICQEHNIPFHTDACQSFTKLDLDETYADMITINGHKIHGPKAIGALYVKEGTPIKKIMQGGSQEMGMRSGTENVPGIIGFSKAADLAMDSDHDSITENRDFLIDELTSNPKVSLNGPKENRLENNINITIRGISGDSLVLKLSQRGISLSTGSACSAHEMEPSHVLKAIGLKDDQALSSLRISISRYTTKEELQEFISILQNEIN